MIRKDIFEERGVAGDKYNNVINDICYYVSEEVSKYCIMNEPESGEEIRIEIPSRILNDINFVKENCLSLTVKVIFHDKKEYVGYGNGAIYTSYEDYVENNKINNGEIEICCFANQIGEIYEITLYNTLYHELNHLYEEYSQIKNSDTLKSEYIKYSRSDISRKIDDILDVFKSECENINIYNKSFIDALYYLLYHLWSDTELNAFISSVYGDLKAIKSKRNEYKKDITKCSSYKIYNDSIKIVNYIKNLEYDFYKCLSIAFNSNGIKCPSNLEAFKKFFINNTLEKIKKLKRGIFKVASLYYDNIEDANKIAESYKEKYNKNCIVEGKIIEVKKDFPTDFLRDFNRFYKY